MARAAPSPSKQGESQSPQGRGESSSDTISLTADAAGQENSDVVLEGGSRGTHCRIHLYLFPHFRDRGTCMAPHFPLGALLGCADLHVLSGARGR